jgi:hypothetical protein
MPSHHAAEKRRSTRVLRAIPVTVSGIDLLGQPFKELTTTITVNRHGCTYRSKHNVPKNSTVTLKIAQPGSASPAQQFQGRVAWVQRPRSVRDLFQIGLEFEKPENVWGIVFPPEGSVTAPDNEKRRLTIRDPDKFDEHNAFRGTSELVEEVEEIIVEESSDDTAKDYTSMLPRPRKTEATIKTHGKKRRKKKKRKIWDVFICHASEDKDSFVRPLAKTLRAEGLRVWYDEFTLRVGDGLRRSIDKGLASSKFGAVVVSPSFFKKQWPQRELDGLVAKETDDRRIILPVWHNVSLVDVRQHSITLADRIAANSAEGIQAVVAKLLLAIRENG